MIYELRYINKHYVLLKHDDDGETTELGRIPADDLHNVKTITLSVAGSKPNIQLHYGDEEAR